MTSEVVQVFVTTPSLGEARPFYEDALRLDPERVGETSIEYATEGARLKVQEDFDDEQLAEFGLDAPPDPPGRGGGAVFVLRVGDIHEACERADGGVGEVVCEPRPVPWGDEIALVRSPAGYVFELRD